MRSGQGEHRPVGATASLYVNNGVRATKSDFGALKLNARLNRRSPYNRPWLSTDFALKH